VDQVNERNGPSSSVHHGVHQQAEGNRPTYNPTCPPYHLSTMQSSGTGSSKVGSLIK